MSHTPDQSLDLYPPAEFKDGVEEFGAEFLNIARQSLPRVRWAPDSGGPDSGGPRGAGCNAAADFRGEQRTNQTHCSATGPDARRRRKSRPLRKQGGRAWRRGGA
jgi:hypothetical protein